MIKFFRKIRHELIKEGNLKKYLIYSFGEILIVMIGILFAIQINNWNENRKNKQDGAYYLKKIESNLRSDIKLLNRYRWSNYDQINMLDSMLIILQQPNNFSTDLFKKNVKVFLHNKRFIPTKISFDNLVSSNNLGIISNQKLLEQIFEYYTKIESIEKIMEESYTYYNRNFIVPYLLSIDYWEYYGSRKKYDFSDVIEERPLIEYAKDIQFINSIRAQLLFLELQGEYYLELVMDAHNLVSSIADEIKPIFSF